ncbi:type III glutamate--ammonia ligase [Citricoccus sp. NPDC079358]|uniref:type III glutamate--ammonia ligase n=1 Tax=Citricoccus sp. NPDC079358 TaxID=3154653 RepID=UPI00344F932C
MTSTVPLTGADARPAPIGLPEPTLAELAAADDVRFLLATFVDMTGRPCAKLVPVSAADELQFEGMGFAGYAAGMIGQNPQDPDLVVFPDLASYAPLPFVKEGLAMVQCDPHVEGVPWPYAPRVALKHTLAKLAERGMRPMVGAELEYFLVRTADNGTIITADERDSSPNPCYDARGVTRMYEHLTEISAAMNSLGWGNYANDHEDGAGQFEQNFAYADALTTADRVITARYIIAMLAAERDMTATFMPKPFTDRPGNGMHLHLSLWDDSGPLFPDDSDGRSLGLSAQAYSFIGGVLEHSSALLAYLAPTVNSYKRRNAQTTVSGATWSPRKATYGGNDRTHFIRVPDGNRIELRGGDGSGNPYLMMASVLEAGLDGIDRQVDPGDPCGPGIQPDSAADLPSTLLHAAAALRADTTVLGALCGSRAVGEYYADAKEQEFLSWHNQVSQWEVDSYLTHV